MFNDLTHRQPNRSPRSAVDAVSPAKQYLLTKGDNNYIDDIDLYQGLQWLERKHIVGKVRGFLPYIGYVTIAMVSSSPAFGTLSHTDCPSRMTSRN